MVNGRGFTFAISTLIITQHAWLNLHYIGMNMSQVNKSKVSIIDLHMMVRVTGLLSASPSTLLAWHV